MVETTARSSELLLRFDRGERVLHWVNATLMLTLLFTGSALYVPALSTVIARRHLIETIHVYCGLALPFPLLLTFAARRWGAAFRADVRRLNRWDEDDRRWFRSRGRDAWVRVGKFNAGQKLNAAWNLGVVPVMVATGSIMYWPNIWPLAWRTGATFVHDWIYIGLVITVTGHIMFAVNDGESLRSMVGGRISAAWAKKHAPRWYEEETGLPADTRRPSGHRRR